MKKTVRLGKRVVDIDFEKGKITVSVWGIDDTLPMGYSYFGESTFTTNKGGN